MKTILCVMLAIALPLLAMAQPIVTVLDRGCEQLTCPPTFISPTSCTSQGFTVPFTGTYAVDAWTACQSSTICYGCMSCVVIYNAASTQPVFVGGTRNCVDRECTGTALVQLQAGVQYSLQVCLEPCPNQPDCRQCREDCTAGGCVRDPRTRPCY